jgi:hypothetical protein
MANAVVKADDSLLEAMQLENGPVDSNATSDGKKRTASEMMASLNETEIAEESKKKHKAGK